MKERNAAWLLLAVLCAVLIAGCQPKPTYEVVTDTAALPEEARAALDVLTGAQGHFGLQRGFYVLDTARYKLSEPLLWVSAGGAELTVSGLSLGNRGDLALHIVEAPETGVRGVRAKWFLVRIKGQFKSLTAMGSQGNPGKPLPLPLLDANSLERDAQMAPPITPVPFDRVFAHVEEKLPTQGITRSRYAETMDDWQSPDTLVTVHRGECASTGYGIQVTKVLYNGQDLFDVYVALLNPEPGVPESDVITLPIDSVRIKGWEETWRFRLVVEGTTVGPFEPENVAFAPMNLGNSTPESALGRPLPNELGVSVLPLVAQTDKVDTALLVHRPQCPSSGYGIKVTRITRDIPSGLLTVYVKLTDPAPGSPQSTVITQPVDVVRIDGYRPDWSYRVIVE